jgi:CheY-like chemotaxis protein
VLKLQIQKLGYLCEVAADGAAAVAAVAQAEGTGRRFDVVVMDYHMDPGIDGLEATRQIRLLEGIEQPAILLLTADGRTEKLENEARESGIDAFYMKPIREGLREALETNFQERH